MKNIKELEYPGFFSCFLGLFLAPGSTTEALFQRRPPSYVVRFLIIFMLVLFIPLLFAILTGSGTGISEFDIKNYISLIGVIVLTIVFFVAVEGIMLLILGVDASPMTVMAMAIYSLSPLAVTLLVLYVLSYWSSGEIQLADRLLAGNFNVGAYYLRILPYLVAITQIAIVYIFFWSLVAGGHMGLVGALAVLIVSLVPLGLAFSLAVYAMNHYAPGSSDLVMDFITMPLNLDFFKGSGGV